MTAITTPANILGAVSKSHGTTDAAIIARIKSVASAIDAGITVKTLAADLKAASATDSSIIPVVQSTLGYATGVLAIIDKLGISLKTALDDAPALVQTYKAIMRHGKKSMLERLVPAAIEGTTPAEKMTALEGEAVDAVADAVADRPRVGGKPREGKAETVTITEYDKILHAMAAAVGSRAYSPTPEFLTALHNLVNVVTETAPKAKAPASKALATV